MRRQFPTFLLCLFLIVATLAVFWQVRNHELVNFDDHHYITENPHLQAGLTPKNVIWAFTTTHASNWHPLTWLSHTLDCQLYGLNPSGHHLTSVLLHLANTLLLFLVLRRMTGALWRSGFVAALFALHPLHVESVAWVAERKDVLSTLFWMLTIWAYCRYVSRPVLIRYLLIALFFTLGLMAKPMLVTLPLVLLLLDYWPLGRLQIGGSHSAHNLLVEVSDTGKQKKSSALRLVLEKFPLFALAAISSVVTLIAQQRGGALGSVDLYPIKIRVANAFISYVSYMGKMIWPHHLTVYYPYPRSALPIWQAAGAALILICVSIAIMRASRQQPYLSVGWLWYLVTLVPVIGLVQVGTQAMADRYTYVPLIGLFIIIAWGFPDLLEKWRHRRIGLDLLAGAVLLISMICTWKQLHHWRNSITLWQHALSVTQNNYLAHENLGIAFAEQGMFEEAIAQQRKATQIMPNSAEAHNNLAVALAQQGRFTEAVTHYYEVLRLRPDTAEAHNNLGNAMVELGKIEAAVDHYLRAIQLEPQYAEAYNNLGNALAQQRKLNEAIAHYAQALRIKPTYAKAHNNLGVALARQGRFDEAIARFKKALELQPEYAQARNNLEIAVQDKIKANEKFDTMSKP